MIVTPGRAQVVMHSRSMPAVSIMATISAGLTPVFNKCEAPDCRNNRSISGTESNNSLIAGLAQASMIGMRVSSMRDALRVFVYSSTSILKRPHHAKQARRQRGQNESVF